MAEINHKDLIIQEVVVVDLEVLVEMHQADKEALEELEKILYHLGFL
jgi:hypothetical protein